MNPFLSLSKLTAWSLVLLVLLWLILFPSANPLAWDVFGYYLYLPATFLYGDLGFEHIEVYEAIIEKYKSSSTFYQVSGSPAGHMVIRYPMGMAVLYLPFFFAAHLAALFFDLPADGFSEVYQWGINMGSFTYTAIGIFFMRKVLITFFSEGVAALVMFIIVIGTNYFHIVAYNGSMPHNFLFTVYTLILWLTIRWYREGKKTDLVFLALLCGLNILSRPSEVVCLLIPLLWNVHDRTSFREKLNWWKARRKDIAIVTVILFAVGLPQFIYWKVYAGSFFYDSYNNAGEGFDLFTPHLSGFLFSFRKGWLVYTPVMLFALAGIAAAVLTKWKHAWAIFFFVVCNVLLISSWSNWWYADSFSQRSIVQSYAVLALPLGVFFSWLREKNMAAKVSVAAAVSGCVLLNLFQTWQVSHEIIHTSRMTFAYYKAVFGETVRDPALDTLLLVDRNHQKLYGLEEAAYNKTLVHFDGFESHCESCTSAMTYSGNNAYLIDGSKEIHAEVRIPFEELTDQEYAWVRVSVMVYCPGPIEPGSMLLAVSFDHWGRSYEYQSMPVEEFCPEPGKWCRMSLDYLTPEVRKGSDALKVHFWQQGESVLYIDDLRIEKFEPK